MPETTFSGARMSRPVQSSVVVALGTKEVKNKLANRPTRSTFDDSAVGISISKILRIFGSC